MEVVRISSSNFRNRIIIFFFCSGIAESSEAISVFCSEICCSSCCCLAANAEVAGVEAVFVFVLVDNERGIGTDGVEFGLVVRFATTSADAASIRAPI